jgi:hypothetical protein
LRYLSRPSDEFTTADAAAYASWFPRPDGKLAGEWTPEYADDLSSIRNLAAAAPNAKLLLLVRDPIDRYRSDLTMLGQHRGADAKAARRGRYATQVADLCTFFPRTALLLLQYERCIASLDAELARTYRFLQLDDEFTPRFPTQRRNVTRRPKVPLPNDRVRELTSFFEPEVLGLAEMMPELDLALWPSMRHLA